jgi:hypothetical protein
VSLSPRLRFLVLKRDEHTCRYCGARAPHVELQVDHVVPISRGGTDDMENLVTSCQPCNAGKGALDIEALQGFCMANSDTIGPPHIGNGYTGCPCGEPVYAIVRETELCRRHWVRLTKIYPVLRRRHPGRDPSDIWYDMRHGCASKESIDAAIAWENRILAEIDG